MLAVPNRKRFVRRLRVTLGAEAIPTLEAYRVDRVRPSKRQAVFAMVDRAYCSTSYASECGGASGRFLIPSRLDHFDHASCIASISSRVKRLDMLTRATTDPGTSPSSTSCSMRANVIVNS